MINIGSFDFIWTIIGNFRTILDAYVTPTFNIHMSENNSKVYLKIKALPMNALRCEGQRTHLNPPIKQLTVPIYRFLQW